MERYLEMLNNKSKLSVKEETRLFRLFYSTIWQSVNELTRRNNLKLAYKLFLKTPFLLLTNKDKSKGNNGPLERYLMQLL